jgi:hypothetical protein
MPPRTRFFLTAMRTIMAEESIEGSTQGQISVREINLAQSMIITSRVRLHVMFVEKSLTTLS